MLDLNKHQKNKPNVFERVDVFCTKLYFRWEFKEREYQTKALCENVNSISDFAEMVKTFIKKNRNEHDDFIKKCKKYFDYRINSTQNIQTLPFIVTLISLLTTVFIAIVNTRKVLPEKIAESLLYYFIFAVILITVYAIVDLIKSMFYIIKMSLYKLIIHTIEEVEEEASSYSKSETNNKLDMLNLEIRRIEECIKKYIDNTEKKVYLYSESINEAIKNVNQNENSKEIIRIVDSIFKDCDTIKQNLKLSAEVSEDTGGKLKDKDENNTIAELKNKIEKAINSLSEKSNSISKVIEAINGISQKTNLLSFNASIEAARAGEAGMGFSIVAKEIGELSKQSEDATKKAEKLLKEIQNEIENTLKN